MSIVLRGLWNVVLSGYPKSGKTTLANKLIAENQYFARIGVDELRQMIFNEFPPCLDEFLIYSMIAEMREDLLKKGYSTGIDSTAPNNITRQFLLETKLKNINRLLVVLNVNREILIKGNIEKSGDASAVFAWDKRWEEPKANIPIFKFKSNNLKEFDAYYARLIELLESEMHPFKPEFHQVIHLEEIRKALKNFLKKHL